MKFRLFATISCILFVGCGANKLATDTPPAYTQATLKFTSLPGVSASCRNLMDLEFTIANADRYAKPVIYRNYDVKGIYNSKAFQDYREKKYREYIKNTRSNEKETVLKPDKLEPVSEYFDPLAYFELMERNDYIDSYLAGSNMIFDYRILSKIYDDYTSMLDKNIEVREQQYPSVLAKRRDTSFVSSTHILRTINNRFRQFYVSQQSPETCYAASLQNIWRYYGWRANYQDFVEKRVPKCELLSSKRKTASFNEIISTAYHLRTGHKAPLYDTLVFNDDIHDIKRMEFTQRLFMGSLHSSHSYTGIQFSSLSDIASSALYAMVSNAVPLINPFGPANYLNSNPLDNLQKLQSQVKQNLNPNIREKSGNVPNFYRAFGWQQTNNPGIKGYVQPIRDTGAIIASLLSGDAMLVGLTLDTGGHTFLITGAEYEPDFYYDKGNRWVWTSATAIKRVRLLDPTPQADPESWMSANEFFSRYRFGIVFHQDR